MDFVRIEGCVKALRDDHARQSGFLSAQDAARVVDRRGLKPDEAAEVWRRIEDLGLLALPAEAAAEEVGNLDTDGESAAGSRDLDLLHLFIGDIRGVPRLSEAEVVQLAHLIRVGTQAEEALGSGAAAEPAVASLIEAGRQARDRFVRANIRLVIYFAKEYFAIPGASKLDIIQDGVIGLMKAIDRYEPARGYRFATYAVWWIRQRILLGVAGRDGVINLPPKIGGKLRRMAMKRNRFRIESGRAPTLLELARELEMEPGELRFLQQLEGLSVSLDDLAPGTNKLRIGDALQDVSSPDPEEQFARGELISAVQKNLGEMSDRDRAIVQRRFGFDSGEEATLQEIADEFGLSRERIRQIIESAVDHFRQKAAWRRLL